MSGCDPIGIGTINISSSSALTQGWGFCRFSAIIDNVR